MRALTTSLQISQLESSTSLTNIAAQAFQLLVKINSMGDVVPLRDLIKSSPRGQTIDHAVLLRIINITNFPDRLVSRATNPRSAEDVARAYRSLCVVFVWARANSATAQGEFSSWYTETSFSGTRHRRRALGVRTASSRKAGCPQPGSRSLECRRV